MSVSFNGVRLMLSTGVKSDMQAWDAELQRMKSVYAGSSQVNSWLQVLDETARRTWEQLAEGDAKPDARSFRSLFMTLKPGYSSGFFDVYLNFMEDGMKRWNTGTYRKVKTIFTHLREFEQWSGNRLAFTAMDEVFIKQFSDFYREKGNRPSTTRKAVNILVWFLNWATENGYNVNREYRRFYKDLEKGAEILQKPLFLKWDELRMLNELKLESKRTERVRDLFCFICFTGLKFSELQALRKEDVLDNELIIKRKNGSQRRVPMNKYAREIHLAYENKYYLSNTAFPSLSIITMNKYLRSLGKEAGLSRLVDSGTDSSDMVPLYSRLTAGTGVQTFLANALELGIPYELISGFTGIRSNVHAQRIMKVLESEQLSKLESR